MGGAALGQTLIPIPFLGAFIGAFFCSSLGASAGGKFLLSSFVSSLLPSLLPSFLFSLLFRLLVFRLFESLVLSNYSASDLTPFYRLIYILLFSPLPPPLQSIWATK